MGDRRNARARHGWQAVLGLITGLVVSLVGSAASASASTAGAVLQVLPTAYTDWGIDASMAYDPDTAQVVLYGGQTPTSMCGCNGSGGTWVWNGTDFIGVVPPGTGSTDGRLVYDGATHQLLRIDGSPDVNTPPTGAMFVWTGSSWTPVVPAHQPVARSEESVAYDARTHQLILFGGNIHGANDPAADTWEWSGSDWVQLAPATSPSARAGATMAYDDATGQLVLTGGRGAGLQQLADTWVWTGTTWKQLVPKTSPGMFWAGTATFDPALDALVLFGGPLAPLGTPAGINQMWKWTGSNWQLIPTAVSPSDVASPTMAYDTATAQLVLMAPNRDKVDAFHTLMLVAAPTKTTLTAATSTVVAGQPVSIVAKVAAKQVAVPGGSVTFTDDNVTIPGCAGVAVVGGAATCMFSPANGAPKVRAQYGPMAGFLASSAGALTLTVG